MKSGIYNQKQAKRALESPELIEIAIERMYREGIYCPAVGDCDLLERLSSVLRALWER